MVLSINITVIERLILIVINFLFFFLLIRSSISFIFSFNLIVSINQSVIKYTKNRQKKGYGGYRVARVPITFSAN